MLKQVILAEHLNEINQMIDEILERAKTGNDTRAIEIIENYIRPVVLEHLKSAQAIADKESQRVKKELEKYD